MILEIGMDTIIILTLVVIIGSIVAVIMAMSTMKRNHRRYEEAPEKHARGEVIKLIMRVRYTDISGLNTDPNLIEWNFRKGNYLVQILREDGIFMLLNCNNLVYKKLVIGYYGDITYKANIMLDFRRRKNQEEQRKRDKEDKPYFFKNRESKGKTLGFYLDAPSYQIQISESNRILCDIYEVKNYAKRMFDNTSENYFGLVDNDKSIQFFNDGSNEKNSIDIPESNNLGIYQTEIDGVDSLYEVIDMFFQEKDIVDLLKMELMIIE